jgi:hypothetical protein
MAEGSPSEETPVARPTSLYNIVVLGTMNPRLHHPLWYRMQGCITEEEEKAAADITIVKPLAQFSAGRMTIICTDDRWEIRTHNEKLRERLLDIASIVFTKLYETQIVAIGFNTLADLIAGVPSVPRVLGRLGGELSLGFEPADNLACEFGFRKRESLKMTVAAVLASSIHDTMVHVRYNSHHDMKPTSGYYDLAPILQEHFGPHKEGAAKFQQAVLDRLAEVSRQ